MAINLELEPEELNLVLNGLGNLKYVESANLINKIRILYSEQAQAQAAEVKEDTEDTED